MWLYGKIRKIISKYPCYSFIAGTLINCLIKFDENASAVIFS